MNTEIAKVENTFTALAIDGEAFRQIVKVNLADDGISAGDLDKIKMPIGDNAHFTINNIRGDEAQREFEGIVIAEQKNRAYFAGAFAGGGVAPECSSSDGYKSTGTGKLCYNCKLSQFGSDGAGQACRLNKLLFILLPGNTLPHVLSVPPSSLKPLRRYKVRLTSQKLAFNDVVTRFSTTKAASKDGVKYAQLELNLDRVLTPAEQVEIRAYAEDMRPLLKGAEAPDGSLIQEHDEDVPPDFSVYEAEADLSQPLESDIPF